MDAPLLRTKLYAPRAAGGLVPRGRLVARLAAARCGMLALVSAPAGYGKTTLIAEWLREAGLSVAWLSLDAQDSDPARFWTYVAAALEGVRPGIAAALAPALGAGEPPPPESLVAHLVNAILDAPQQFALVLDDYHLITGADVHEGVEFLVDNLPPNMLLVIASRADPPWPLARRRARRQLVEIREADLRFTEAEAAAFLGEVMALDLARRDVSALAERTEGWIAGLQMAALSLRGHEDAAGFVDAFTGSDRYVLDYLLEEVLERLPEDTRAFLLETCVLERLSGPLCDALTGRADGQASLERLEAANLFLIPLDSARRWYRYHHLFADLLRGLAAERLGAERLAALHRRASAWYAEHGHAEEAIAHALRGGDVERAAELVRRHALAYMARGQMRTVARWLAGFPEDVVRCNPALALQRARLCAPGEDPEPWLALALGGAEHVQPPEGLPYPTFADYARTVAAVLRAARARFRREPFAGALALAQSAYDSVPREDALLRAYAARSVAATFVRYEQAEAAEAWFAQARQPERGDGDLADLAIAGLQGQQMWYDGRLRALRALCERTLREVVQPAERAGQSLAWASLLYVLLGRVRLQWNDLEQAEPTLLRGIALAEGAGEGGAMRDGRRALATLRAAQHRFDEALALLGEPEGPVRAPEGMATPFLHNFVVRMWVWRSRVEGDPSYLQRAIRWADAADIGPLRGYNFGLQSVAWVRIAQRRALGGPDLGPLLGMLEENLRGAQADRGVGFRVEMHALQALALAAEGRLDEALEALGQGLRWSELEGYRRHLMDHGAPMLALLEEGLSRGLYGDYARALAGAIALEEPADVDVAGTAVADAAVADAAALPVPAGAAGASVAPQASAAAPAARAAEGLLEPISEREGEILRYLAGPLSSTEIGGELFLSPNTVRFHIKNLYDKLGVHSRREAVDRARDLGLL